MKTHYPSPPSLYFLITLLSLSLFSCNGHKNELMERMLQQIEDDNQNKYDQFMDLVGTTNYKIDGEMRNGNRKFADLIDDVVEIKEATQRFQKELQRVEENDSDLAAMPDSVVAITRKWSATYKKFCRAFGKDRYPYFPFVADTSAGWNEAEIKVRFAEADASERPIETALLKARMLTQALTMARHLSAQIGSAFQFRIDSLVLQALPQELTVEAGEEAPIALSVLFSSAIIPTEYTGSGRIEMDPGGSWAVMYVKTSEAMIPAGQNEAYVTYQVEAKIPRADGGIQNQQIIGKVKIRRPCGSEAVK